MAVLIVYSNVLIETIHDWHANVVRCRRPVLLSAIAVDLCDR